MSTANHVPETWGLTGDDAVQTLERTGRGALIRDAFKRLRYADGFSHARSMAFLTTLVFLQAVIALVGLASALRSGGVSDVIVKTLRQIVPGPAGKILTDAVQQAHEAGSSHRYVALIVGLAGCADHGNDVDGSDRASAEPHLRRRAGSADAAEVRARVRPGDHRRPPVRRGLRRARARSRHRSSLSSHGASTVWNVLRWPLALAVLIAAIALLFNWSPRRHQPGWSWLAFGAIVSVILLAIVTIALDGMFRLSSTFGTTYGPLAGIVALLLWAVLASVALLFGAAIGAQLEAVRGGRPDPQSTRKVTESEPDLVRP